MQHLELLLVPALMLSDYALTIAGARLRERVYARHFATEHYELNPAWQTSVARKRWFNPRHLLATACVTMLIFAGVALIGDDDPDAVPMLIGAFLGVFGSVNGRHLGNLATFAYLARHPESLRGTVTLSHGATLAISMFAHLAVVLPAVLLALFSLQPIVVGFAFGTLVMLAINAIWLLRWRRAQKRAERDGGGATIASDGAQSATMTSTSSVSTASATNLPCESSSAKRPP
jgi:hypothetical protein